MQTHLFLPELCGAQPAARRALDDLRRVLHRGGRGDGRRAAQPGLGDRRFADRQRAHQQSRRHHHQPQQHRQHSVSRLRARSTDEQRVSTPTQVDARTGSGRSRITPQVALYFRTGNLQVTAVDYVSVGRPQFINVLLIDPQTFPPTGDIHALDPAGTPLRDLFTGGNDIVISQNLADSQGIKVGDTVRVSNTTDLYTVRGIVSTEIEASITNPFAAFFGFAYLDASSGGETAASDAAQHDQHRPAAGRRTSIRRRVIAAADYSPAATYSTVPDLLETKSDDLPTFWGASSSSWAWARC